MSFQQPTPQGELAVKLSESAGSCPSQLLFFSFRFALGVVSIGKLATDWPDVTQFQFWTIPFYKQIISCIIYA